jgi:hypothetical protein
VSYSAPVTSEDQSCHWHNNGLRCDSFKTVFTPDSFDQSKKEVNRRWFCRYHAFCFLMGIPDTPATFEAWQKEQEQHKADKLSMRPNDKLDFDKYTANEIESMKRGAKHLLRGNQALQQHPTFKTFYAKLHGYKSKEVPF